MGAGRHSSILELETIGSVTNHTRFGDRVAESYQVGVETRDNRTWWPRPKLFAKICCASMWKGSGAARGIRTPDPRITNAVLYRLSYCGVKCASLIPGAGRIGKARRAATELIRQAAALYSRSGWNPSPSGSAGGNGPRSGWSRRHEAY